MTPICVYSLHESLLVRAVAVTLALELLPQLRTPAPSFTVLAPRVNHLTSPT